MLRPFLFSALFAVLLAACSTGKTALNHGHFDLAVKRASQRLQQPKGLGKRGYTLAPWVLQQAFVRAYEQHQTTIRQLSSPANPAPFRWETVYSIYEKLQTLTDDAHKAHQALDRRVLAVCDSCPGWPFIPFRTRIVSAIRGNWPLLTDTTRPKRLLSTGKTIG